MITSSLESVKCSLTIWLTKRFNQDEVFDLMRVEDGLIGNGL